MEFVQLPISLSKSAMARGGNLRFRCRLISISGNCRREMNKINIPIPTMIKRNDLTAVETFVNDDSVAELVIFVVGPPTGVAYFADRFEN